MQSFWASSAAMRSVSSHTAHRPAPRIELRARPDSAADVLPPRPRQLPVRQRLLAKRAPLDVRGVPAPAAALLHGELAHAAARQRALGHLAAVTQGAGHVPDVRVLAALPYVGFCCLPSGRRVCTAPHASPQQHQRDACHAQQSHNSHCWCASPALLCHGAFGLASPHLHPRCRIMLAGKKVLYMHFLAVAANQSPLLLN
mmetsp:Transcript_29576/g.75395  ORF Transcript_29576/g.75395 Transcript_29576/m.75395 type:complete len:200 (-) Transcript_29576:20-619(-)